jgi:hypothetical protein
LIAAFGEAATLPWALSAATLEAERDACTECAVIVKVQADLS